MFFKLARQNCSHYSRVGPNQRAHYCWLDGVTCNLQPDVDMGCLHFINAVLPLDKDLEAKWLSLQQPGQDSATNLQQSKTNHKPGTYRTCACGGEFRVTSNRQRFCPECGRTNRKSLVREAVRAHRARRGSM
jgi:hypothetical protein